jgi:hypothetical protein
MVFFGLRRHIDSLVDANVSEERAVSIYRTEVMSRYLEGPYAMCPKNVYALLILKTRIKIETE